MADHSPTPWHVVINEFNTIIIKDANGNTVRFSIASYDSDRANAEAIVRYVNSCAEKEEGARIHRSNEWEEKQ